jgi:hypothetical protein
MSEVTQFLTNSEGEKIAVVMPISRYEELIEDVHDLAVIAERREESTLSFEGVKRRLKKDGLLSD